MDCWAALAWRVGQPRINPADHGKLTWGGYGARNLKKTGIVLEERGMEISPRGLVVSSCLDCDVREVS